MRRLKKFLKTWSKNLDLAFVHALLETFPKSQVFLVGGMVRDIALGIDSKDYDLVVSGVSGKKLQEFLSQHGTVDLVGRSFGVYKFKPKNKARVTGYGLRVTSPIDIALPRTEHSFGTGGYKDVEVKSDYRLSIKEDLKRRDFTINAIALELTEGQKNRRTKKQIVDPFNGLEDIQKKTIRCVGKPKERFIEDYSRILRCIRFSCQLDFEIAPGTWSAAKQLIKKVNAKRGGEFVIAREIIAKELVKAFAKNPVWALELMDKSGAMQVLMPELLKMKKSPQPKEFHAEGDVWEHTKLALQKLYSKEFKKEFSKYGLRVAGYGLPSNELIWGLLFHDAGKPYTLTVTDRIRNNNHDTKGAQLFKKISERLKLSSGGLNTEQTEKLIAKHMLPTQAAEMKETTLEKYFFNELFPGLELMMLIFADISATIPPSGKPDFSSYRLLKKRIQALHKKSKNKKSLPNELLDGREIMRLLKIKPGKRVGEIKDELRELQLKGKIKNKTQAKNYLKK